MKFIKYGVFIDMCIDDVRKHIISPIDLIIVDDSLIRYHIYNIYKKDYSNHHQNTCDV